MWDGEVWSVIWLATVGGVHHLGLVLGPPLPLLLLGGEVVHQVEDGREALVLQDPVLVGEDAAMSPSVTSWPRDDLPQWLWYCLECVDEPHLWKGDDAGVRVPVVTAEDLDKRLHPDLGVVVGGGDNGPSIGNICLLSKPGGLNN